MSQKKMELQLILWYSTKNRDIDNGQRCHENSQEQLSLKQSGILIQCEVSYLLPGYQNILIYTYILIYIHILILIYLYIVYTYSKSLNESPKKQLPSELIIKNTRIYSNKYEHILNLNEYLGIIFLDGLIEKC